MFIYYTSTKKHNPDYHCSKQYISPFPVFGRNAINCIFTSFNGCIQNVHLSNQKGDIFTSVATKVRCSNRAFLSMLWVLFYFPLNCKGLVASQIKMFYLIKIEMFAANIEIHPHCIKQKHPFKTFVKFSLKYFNFTGGSNPPGIFVYLWNKK